MKTREKAYKPAILQIDPERSHKNIMFQQIQRISRDQRPILTLAKKCRAEIRDIIYIYILSLTVLHLCNLKLSSPKDIVQLNTEAPPKSAELLG